MTRFKDATVLVTGASRGLGRAIAIGFATEGAFVFIGHRVGATAATETLNLVRAAGGDGALAPFDVTDATKVDEAIAGMLNSRPQLDVVVNCAGLARDELFPLMQRESWRQVIATNLDGTFNVCRAVARPMMGKKKGAIINVASVAGQRASVGQVNYAASKGGVLALTQSLAAELAPRGIRVNAVVPGVCTTGMTEALDRRIIEARRAQIPLGRLGTGDEIARAVLFLASSDAAYIVGQALVVDGGLTL